MLYLIGQLFVGLIFGLLARGILPGRQTMGLFMTAILGAAGSLLANKIGQLLNLYQAEDKAGWIASILGAVIVLMLYSVLIKGKKIGEDFDSNTTNDADKQPNMITDNTNNNNNNNNNKQ